MEARNLADQGMESTFKRRRKDPGGNNGFLEMCINSGT